ncbi:MAG: hypothetical protein U5L11_00545 [Arhodomonas sp.]|nr:hypothetical protein [Arhodomonas sp.]
MRLADGTLWPMPITLDVTEDFAAGLAEGQRIALRDAEGVLVAVMDVAAIYRPDRAREARGRCSARPTPPIPAVGLPAQSRPIRSTSAAG